MTNKSDTCQGKWNKFSCTQCDQTQGFYGWGNNCYSPDITSIVSKLLLKKLWVCNFRTQRRLPSFWYNHHFETADSCLGLDPIFPVGQLMCCNLFGLEVHPFHRTRATSTSLIAHNVLFAFYEESCQNTIRHVFLQLFVSCTWDTTVQFLVFYLFRSRYKSTADITVQLKLQLCLDVSFGCRT